MTDTGDLVKHIKGIGGSVSKLEGMRRRLESTQLNAVRELLTDKAIMTICNECNYYFRVVWAE
jgi:hypothetical protein